MPKMKCARAGSTTRPSTKALNNAKVLVNANGLKSFPSADSIAKTGTKLTTVVANAVVIADATSTVAT